jgi:hypothetical protein
MRDADIQPGTTSTHETRSSAIRFAVANEVSRAIEEASFENKSS